MVLGPFGSARRAGIGDGDRIFPSLLILTVFFLDHNKCGHKICGGKKCGDLS